MKLYIRILLLGIILLFSSCKSEEIIAPHIIPIDLSNNKVNCMDSTYFINFKEVRLQSSKNAVVNQIGKIMEIDNKIYIFDSELNQIVVFDYCGNYIKTINKVGRGPGEYIRITDVTYDRNNNQILILADTRNLLYYTKDGVFIKREKLDYFYTDIFTDSTYIYLCNSPYANRKIPEYAIECINKETGEKSFLLKVDKEYAPYCTFGNKFFGDSTGLYFVRMFEDKVYHISNGKPDRTFNLDFHKFTFPQEKLKKQFECDEIFELCYKNKYIYMLTNFATGKNNAIFRSNLEDLYIFSKRNKEGSIYRFISNSKYKIPLHDYYPVDGNISKCCFILSPSTIINLREFYQKQDKLIKDPTTNYIMGLKDITLSSNPILFFYEIK